MTVLTSYADTAPFAACRTSGDFGAIAAVLATAGVTLERWPLRAAAGAGDAGILAAHAGDIARLQARGGYRAQDLVRLAPDHPHRARLRRQFLAEHVHDDDEVRFFVAGSGLFFIRHDGAVHAVECTAGDLIALPAGTRHWFDTGEYPDFTAIRLFTDPQGWVARHTGDTIAGSIPAYAGARADHIA